MCRPDWQPAQVFPHSDTNHYRSFHFVIDWSLWMKKGQCSHKITMSEGNIDPSIQNSFFAKTHTYTHTYTHWWLWGGFRGFPVRPGSKESASLYERWTTWVMLRCKSSLRQQWQRQICVTWRYGQAQSQSGELTGVKMIVLELIFPENVPKTSSTCALIALKVFTLMLKTNSVKQRESKRRHITN